MQKKRVFISSVQSEFANEPIEQLYSIHNSIPANPLLAEPMYLRGTIERMGTGTEEMASLCIKKGLQKPVFQQQTDC